jgi:hypothetical protein
MSETAEPGAMTTEEVLSITRQHNYGIRRIQTTWKTPQATTPKGLL